MSNTTHQEYYVVYPPKKKKQININENNASRQIDRQLNRLQQSTHDGPEWNPMWFLYEPNDTLNIYNVDV